MRRRALALPLLALALGVAAPLSAQGTITVRAGSGGGGVGYSPNAQVAVPVVIDMSNAAGANIASLTTQIKWGPTRLTLDSVVAGTFGSVAVNDAAKANGDLTLGVFNTTGTTTTVTVATLWFTTTTGATTVTVVPTAAGNEAGNSILATLRARWLDACVASGGLWGDVNVDATVNIVDAQQLARSSVGLSVLNAAAVAAQGDVNADGVVNIVDAQQIARFSVGLSASPRVNTTTGAAVTVASLTVPHVYEATAGSLNPSAEQTLSAMMIGGEAQIRALATDAGSADVTACAGVTYSSNNTSAVTVSATGLITAAAAGSATITVTAGSVTTTLPVFVQGNIVIATSVTPAASGTVTGAGTYAPGNTVTLAATPAGGYAFLDWTESGTTVATTATYSFTASASRTLTATFATTATLTTSSSPTPGGTTKGGGTFAVGASATVVATAQPGYRFANWTEGGTVLSTSASYVVTMTANRALVANFVATPVRVSFDAGLGSPAANAIVGDTLTIWTSVTTTLYAVDSVVATLGGTRLPLVKNASGYWAGTINLAGMPRDTLQLLVQGWDANGGTGETTRRFIHDLAPVVTVIQPQQFDVARPTISYSATCSDDDPAGCTSLKLLLGTTVVATGTSSISGVVTLSSTNTLKFVGTDSRGRTTTVERIVYTEASAELTLLGSAGGTVLDVRGGRALYRNDDGTRVGITTLSSGANEVISAPPGGAGAIGVAFLTPAGALFTQGTSPYVLYDWRAGVLTNTGVVTPPELLLVRGNHALFAPGPWANNPDALTPISRRDLATGADALITTKSARYGADMAFDGSVVYQGIGTLDNNIFLDRGGVVTSVTNSASPIRNMNPQTDGPNVVYFRTSNGTDHDIVYFDGTNSTVLTTEQISVPYDDFYYAVNGGWAAFLKRDVNSVFQVWTRSPAGVLRKVSAFNSGSVIEAIGADGTVVFRTLTRRYLAGPTSGPKDVSQNQGKVVWRDGDFYMMLGRVAFRINP